VAIGDSSTEGLNDPDGTGGYRGWADRLAERIARSQGSLLYANLAIRGRRTRQIRDEQLDWALAMQPDLATLFSGTNDVVARRFEMAQVAEDIESMHEALIARGATLLTFTLPDLTAVMPLGRLVSARVEALNRSLREIASRTGAVLVDLAEHPVASDPRLWSADRLHANSQGHARMAEAFAHALAVPGADVSWSAPLPAAPRPSALERMRAEARWIRRFLLPWLLQHWRGRSSGDGLAPKRPDLQLLAPSQQPLTARPADSLLREASGQEASMPGSGEDQRFREVSQTPPRAR
jgi:lysophospholipase L1-like esterase